VAGGAYEAVSERAWLAAVCASELGTLLVFSNFSALLPLLQREWNLSNSQAGLIVSFYQFGYIGAVMILATLTDYMPPRRIYLWSAFWMAAASFAFAFWAQGFLSAIILRFAVGLGLAGTYMPGMRMVAERFASGSPPISGGPWRSSPPSASRRAPSPPGPWGSCSTGRRAWA
jgi:MFS family permease